MKLLSEYEPELPTTRLILQEWSAWLDSQHHLNDVSRYNMCVRVRTVYNYLKLVYEWEKNPTDGLTKTVKLTTREHRIFSPQELYQIFDSLKTDFQKILCRVILDSTCRIHEAASLNVSQIVNDNTGFTCSRKSKTGQHTYRCRSELCQSMKAIANSTTGYVFAKQDGQPYPADVLASAVQRWIKRSGIKGNKLGAHTFRHTGATLVADETESPILVQAITGQKDMKVVMQYIHTSQQRKAQRYSPLELASKSFHATNDQMSQTALIHINPQPRTTPIKEIVIGTDGNIISTGTNWLEDMFKPVPQNKSIRPLLETQDLEFLRRAFQNIVQNGTVIGDDVKARDLWTRWLRKSQGDNHD